MTNYENHPRQVNFTFISSPIIQVSVRPGMRPRGFATHGARSFSGTGPPADTQIVPPTPSLNRDIIFNPRGPNTKALPQDVAPYFCDRLKGIPC
jgi:hypothetical protein